MTLASARCFVGELRRVDGRRVPVKLRSSRRLRLPPPAEYINSPAYLANQRVGRVIQYMEEELDIKHG